MKILPWRTKFPNNGGKIQQVTSPGECIYVDQIKSSTLGFIAQIKFRPTKQRWFAATISTYHYSDLSYLHLQNILAYE